MNIYDYIEQRDWVDKFYHVWKVKHKREWTDYSPKFLSRSEAKEWRMTKGEELFDKFGREMKLFTCRPSDLEGRFELGWWEIRNDDEWDYFTKVVPGEDYGDAMEILALFNKLARNIRLHSDEPQKHHPHKSRD